MKNRLFKNIGLLTFSQMANYLLPLITIPYITRIVGPENFGLIEFAQAAVVYFIATVNYGYNRTATRQIAAVSGDSKAVSEIFSAVLGGKFLLLIACVFVYGLGLLFVPKFAEQSLILIAAFPIVIGWGLYPVFLFEGMQRVTAIAVADFATKATAAVLILSLLKEKDQYILVPLINGLLQVLYGGLALIFAFRQFKGLQFRVVGWQKIKGQLQDGFYVFISNTSNTITGFGTVVFGGFLLSPYQLGIFAAAYKLIMVASSFLFKPLLSAFYPFLAEKMHTGLQVFNRHFKKGLLYLTIVSVIAALVTITLPHLLITIVFGRDYLEGTTALQIMAPTLVLGSFIHMYLHQGLLHLSKDKIYMYIIVSSGVLALPLNYFLISEFGITGAAWVRIIVDFYLATISAIVFYKAINQKFAN
jgi:PST family polysaccharide transporter